MAYQKDSRGGGKRSYIPSRENKNREIKKALTHRARLRKSYFKLLDKEGESAPTQWENSEPREDRGEDRGEDRRDDRRDDRREERPRENRREDRPQPRESKPLNYVERAKIAKERKEQARKSKLEEVQERRRTIERKSKERELRKERLTKTTKKGQPLMGPRINNLLDKIRKDLP